MQSWEIRCLAIELPRWALRRRDPGNRIRLPGGEGLQQHHVHERAYLLVAGCEINISPDDSSMTGGSGFISQPDPNESRTVRALNDARLVHNARRARATVAAAGGGEAITELIAVISRGEKIDAVARTVDAFAEGPAEAAEDS